MSEIVQLNKVKEHYLKLELDDKVDFIENSTENEISHNFDFWVNEAILEKNDLVRCQIVESLDGITLSMALENVLEIYKSADYLTKIYITAYLSRYKLSDELVNYFKLELRLEENFQIYPDLGALLYYQTEKLEFLDSILSKFSDFDHQQQYRVLRIDDIQKSSLKNFRRSMVKHARNEEIRKRIMEL